MSEAGLWIDTAAGGIEIHVYGHGGEVIAGAFYDERIHVTSNAEVAEAVAALDDLGGYDPREDHTAADDILLATVPADVRAAYLRLVKRARFWATA